jgi:hypothetical protein
MSSSAAVRGPSPYTASRPGARGHQRDDELVQAAELAVQELGAPPQFPQGDADGVAGDVAGTGT